MKYVRIRFAKESHRSYTYHCIDDSVEVGDLVTVQTRDGAKIVEVFEITAAPEFTTKEAIKVQPMEEPA